MARRFRLPEALPLLGGWAATIYVVLWLPMLAITLWLTAGSAWYGIVDGAGDAYSWHSLGIGFGNGSVITRTAGQDTLHAGVQPGSRVLSLDGIAIPPGVSTDAQDWNIKAHLLRARGPVRVVLETGKGQPRTVLLTRTAAHGDALYAGTGLTPVSLSWLGTFTNLLAPVLLIIGACLLFARRRDAVAALLSVALLGLAAANPYAHYYVIRFDAEWLTFAMNTVGGICLLLTLLVFPNGRFVPRWTLAAAVVLPVLCVIGFLIPGVGNWIVPVFTLLALLAMVVRYHRATPNDRQQWRWAMIGFLVGMAILIGPSQVYGHYLGGVEARASFDVALWSWILTPLSVSAPLTIIVAGVVLSVLRYRLYDAQAAVSRSILYGGLTLSLLAIFAGSEKIIEIIGEQYFGESMGALAGGLGAAFAAVAIGPLHHRIAHWVEHRFRKNLIHLRHDLPQLLMELGETSDPAIVADAVLDHLSHGLYATRGAVIADRDILASRNVDVRMIDASVFGKRSGQIGTVEIDKRDSLFPVRVPIAANDCRWLLIGPRPDGSIYDRQERELVSEIATPLAQALRVSANRTARDAVTSARINQIEQALKALEADLHRTTTAE